MGAGPLVIVPEEPPRQILRMVEVTCLAAALQRKSRPPARMSIAI
jgi:hypothetical protein